MTHTSMSLARRNMIRAFGARRRQDSSREGGCCFGGLCFIGFRAGLTVALACLFMSSIAEIGLERNLRSQEAMEDIVTLHTTTMIKVKKAQNDNAHEKKATEPLSAPEHQPAPTILVVPPSSLLSTSSLNRTTSRITKGHGKTLDNSIGNSAYFTLLADPHSGADMVMDSLNHHSNICASGGFPTAALMDQTMPWLGDESIEKGCTLAFIRDSIAEIVEHHQKNDGNPAPDNGGVTAMPPPRCVQNYDRSNDPLRVHLDRLCTFIQQLNGDFSNHAITKLFIAAFVSSDQSVMGCSCPEQTQSRGVKVMADWLEKSYLNETVAVGAKMIRLTRRNLFERYMSLVTTSISQHWSVSTVQEKKARMKAFETKQMEASNGEKYTVNIDWMLFKFELLQVTDEEIDSWARAHGGDILWMDYSQVRDDPAIALQDMATFLGVPVEAMETLRMLRLPENEPTSVSTSAGSFTQFNGQSLLTYIANRDALVDALSSNGYGSYIGSPSYTPIQHIVYSVDKAFHACNERRGLNVTVVTSASIGGATGPSAKFRAALAILLSMLPDSIVILSEGYSGTVNHHIRSLSTFYKELAHLRATMADMKRAHPGAVLVSASTSCCSKALSHVLPGDLFHSDGRRDKQTCKGEACSKLSSDDTSETWKAFMKGLASKHSKSDTMFLDGNLIAGTASDLIRIIRELDIDSLEDDRAVLTDYMYRNPDKIVLDYDLKIFGERFDGVLDKIDVNCESYSANRSRFEKSSSPLFLSEARHEKCAVHHRNSNGKQLPSWNEKGIDILPILDHVDELFDHDVSLSNIDRHFGSEIFYSFDQTGFWGSDVNRDKYRVIPTERFLTQAHNELAQLASSGVESHRWSSLQRTMQSTGFPYWAWYGDWKFCSYRNKDGVDSVPLFTTCASTECSHNFPHPSYMTIIDSQLDPGKWSKVHGEFDKNYPWESKIRKVVWRGGLSENDPTKVYDSQRWRLCKLVTSLTDPSEKEMFDVGFTSFPLFLTAQMSLDETIVGGFAKQVGLMNDFQKYTAILDMDGNSWSSRFGTMLCYNSLAIKVEPAFVDYFFYDLVPWKHYIPIKNDLSDLIENVAFAMDPANDDIVREIIHSANQWCSERFTHKSLAYVMLDTWESYVQYLDQSDPNWSEAWAKKKAQLMEPSRRKPLIKLV